MTNNPPAFPCKWCEDVSHIKQGHIWLCKKHYRFAQMRANAKRNNKYVPSYEDLDVMDNQHCPDCHRQMNWLSREGQETVISLQHYRDGTLALVCRSCNTRHASMSDDTYRDMPKDCKFCPKCKIVKPDGFFSLDKGRTGERKLKSWCKDCTTLSVLQWQDRNRDHYNAKQREFRAKKKADAMLSAREQS